MDGQEQKFIRAEVGSRGAVANHSGLQRLRSGLAIRGHSVEAVH